MNYSKQWMSATSRIGYRFALLLVCCCNWTTHLLAQAATAENAIVITVDGLRWQEMFGGADQRLMNKSAGGVDDVEATQSRFWSETDAQRRTTLLPFIWETIAHEGQLWGDASLGAPVTVTNGRYFSYPGYNEILCGFGDVTIDSNAKVNNRNVTVLEWLHRKGTFKDRVAAFTSWDVFPFIINAQRSGIPVNAGWEPMSDLVPGAKETGIDRLANELPHYWAGVRYDYFTFQGAELYLKAKRPRVLYVAFGETDDWAHAGRYDLYLDAAQRTDMYIRRLWEAAQSLESHRGKTTLWITTDHGRGDGRESWKSHGADIPGAERIWTAMMGPGIPALGVVKDRPATQAQFSATVAASLGYDFCEHDERVAAPLNLSP